jgi:HK97 family phage portal protein
VSRGLLGRLVSGAAPSIRADVGEGITFTDLADPRLGEFLRGGNMSASGVAVTVEGAMRVAAAWRCTHLIAGVCGNLPIDVYRRVSEQERAPAVGHPLRKVLTEKPNGWQTPAEFRKMLTAHAVNRGDGFGLKITSGPRILEIWPLLPERMEVLQNADMTLSYAYMRKDGSRVPLAAADVLHLRGLTLDGIRGMGVIRYAREALGLSIQTEKAGAKLFTQGVLAGGALRTDQSLSEEAYDRLKDSIQENNAGAENAQKLMILEEGLQFDEGMLSAKDAQFLETRKFSRSDVAMFYGVPPHMIGDTEKSTSWGTGLEQQSTGFVQYNALDWLTMWEQSLHRDCLTDKDRADGIFIRIDTRGLLRGDTQSRTEGYAKALGAGGSPAWMTQDEVRGFEDLAPMGGPAAELPKPTNVAPPGAGGPADAQKPGR